MTGPLPPVPPPLIVPVDSGVTTRRGEAANTAEPAPAPTRVEQAPPPPPASPPPTRAADSLETIIHAPPEPEIIRLSGALLSLAPGTIVEGVVAVLPQASVPPPEANRAAEPNPRPLVQTAALLKTIHGDISLIASHPLVIGQDLKLLVDGAEPRLLVAPISS